MEPDQASALRTKVLLLRSAAAKRNEEKPTARQVFESVSADPDLAPFATLGRVKKLCTRLNTEEAEAAAALAASAAAGGRAEAAGASTPAEAAVDVEKTLRPWPAGQSVQDLLQKGPRSIFSLGEIMQSLALDGAAMGADPDFDFRQSLVELGKGWDQRRRFFLFKDEGDSQGIIMALRGVYVGATGQPVFSVEYKFTTRQDGGIGAPNSDATVSILKAFQSGGGIMQVAATPLEQALWLRDLERGALPQESCPAQVHRGLTRSSVAAPEHPPGFEQTGPYEGKQRTLHVSRQCGMCGKSHATKACASCNKGIYYCDKACQTAHWPVHKLVCSGAASPSAVPPPAVGTSVILPIAPLPKYSGVSMLLNTRQGLGVGPACDTSEPTRNPHGTARFAIKCQLRADDNEPMLVYDKPRALQRTVDCSEQPAYGAMERIIRSIGYMSMRAYLWAQREGAQIRIFADAADLPSQDPGW